MSEEEEINHPYWGRIRRQSGIGDWNLELTEEWPGIGSIRIKARFQNPDDLVIQQNYTKLRENWEDIWPRILRRTNEMKATYGYQDTPIDRESDWFSLRLPVTDLATDPEWSIMLQAEEAGWLLDFKGLQDFGGQGVF
ncbi:MAG: hypothetical protein KGS60_16455 [Verrucomicrobia bacterium]|nr:hypothetical protein [Verrucomicrobiota bacterium]